MYEQNMSGITTSGRMDEAGRKQMSTGKRVTNPSDDPDRAAPQAVISGAGE